jgi:ThiF family/Prokaryotic homologs of the JAB domain
MLQISKDVLRQIERDIAAYSPERGGALLGLIGQPIITHFILDQQAQTSGASYLPSRQLTERVQQLELQLGVEFKGVIHSHPGGYDRPSGPDEEAMLEGLNLNPHIPFFVAPIVTTERPRSQLRHHEISLSPGKISCYAAYRDRGGVRVETLPVKEVSQRELARIESTLTPTLSVSRPKPHPLQADLQRLGSSFRAAKPPETFVTEIEGRTIPAGCLTLDGGLELLFFASETYPVTPPKLLVTPEGGDTEEVELPWRLSTPAEERLLTAVKSAIGGSGPYRKVYCPLGKSALTADGEIARLAGWAGCYSGEDPKLAATEVQQGLFARSTGLLSQQISSKRVLIAGTGSVGSYLAEQLIRSGVGAVTLIDPEMVETVNLCRTTYDLTDVGYPKVEALARRLLHINPLVELTVQPKSLLDYQVADFDALVQQADLVIATTDDPAAQRILNRFAYFHGKPTLFVGLYKGAEGGEVIFTIRDRTPCYLCATANRHQAELDLGRVSADGDYGSNGRVMGEVAIAADIHHVTSVAVKMALSLLLPENAQVKLKGFLNPAIEAGFNYLTLSMVPNYWFYPAIFGDTAGQYAYQSVWLTAKSREECPVCGSVHHRVDPRSIALQSVQADEIRAALNGSRS